VLYVIAWNIVRGRMGRAMMAIRDHAMAAESMGVNLPMVKTRTFALSAMYTGLAGSLGAIAVQFVAPDSFNVTVSIFLFVGLIVGGVSSIGGTLIGAAFIEFVPNFADKISKAAPGAVYGVILIAVMFLMPVGAGGFLRNWARRLIRARTHEPDPEAPIDDVEALTHEPAADLPDLTPGPAFAKQPVTTGSRPE
jgi:branched-chain amino acid transport system permease protein